MTEPQPYAALLAKGEGRRQRILLAANALLTRYGWRGVTLGQIAKEAGVTPAGLLHHFESKAQLLHAALDVRDLDDVGRFMRAGDLFEQLRTVLERFERTPELAGLYTVLLAENLDPEAPLHARFLKRHRGAVRVLTEALRRGQRTGRFHPDIDPVVKAVEIVAFLNGIENSWLLDPSIPLTEVFLEYIDSLDRQLRPGGAQP